VPFESRMLRKCQRQQKLSKKEFPSVLNFSTNNRALSALSFEFINFNLEYIVYQLSGIAPLSVIHDQCKSHDLND